MNEALTTIKVEGEAGELTEVRAVMIGTIWRLGLPVKDWYAIGLDGVLYRGLGDSQTAKVSSRCELRHLNSVQLDVDR